MITVNGVDRFNNTLDLYGLSTDDLPTDKIEYLGVNYRLTNGSTIYFMDTKQAKIYSEENAKIAIGIIGEEEPTDANIKV